MDSDRSNTRGVKMGHFPIVHLLALKSTCLHDEECYRCTETHRHCGKERFASESPLIMSTFTVFYFETHVNYRIKYVRHFQVGQEQNRFVHTHTHTRRTKNSHSLQRRLSQQQVHSSLSAFLLFMTLKDPLDAGPFATKCLFSVAPTARTMSSTLSC